MAKELNEDTSFKISLKTLGGIAAALATIISMWFVLQADIEEAKQLPVAPPPDVTRMEFTDVEELKDDLDRIERKIDELK